MIHLALIQNYAGEIFALSLVFPFVLFFVVPFLEDFND
jgi:hypothetical protein